MKMRPRERLNQLRAVDALTREPREISGFSPERDIPAEVKKALFTELDRFAENKKWLEYIVMFNRLELLFPNMAGREKHPIEAGELSRVWSNGLTQTAGKKEIVLHSIGISSSSVHQPALIAAELSAFGQPVESLLTPELIANFLSTCDTGLERGSTSFARDALTAVRLGLRTKEGAFGDANLRSFAWMRLQSLADSRNLADFRIESLAIAKVLFPEHSIEVPADLLAEGKKIAVEELTRFGPSMGAEEIKNLQIATAESVDIVENGRLVVKKSKPKTPSRVAGLPIRPTF